MKESSKRREKDKTLKRNKIKKVNKDVKMALQALRERERERKTSLQKSR